MEALGLHQHLQHRQFHQHRRMPLQLHPIHHRYRRLQFFPHTMYFGNRRHSVLPVNQPGIVIHATRDPAGLALTEPPARPITKDQVDADARRRETSILQKRKMFHQVGLCQWGRGRAIHMPNYKYCCVKCNGRGGKTVVGISEHGPNCEQHPTVLWNSYLEYLPKVIPEFTLVSSNQC